MKVIKLQSECQATGSCTDVQQAGRQHTGWDIGSKNRAQYSLILESSIINGNWRDEATWPSSRTIWYKFHCSAELQCWTVQLTKAHATESLQDRQNNSRKHVALALNSKHQDHKDEDQCRLTTHYHELCYHVWGQDLKRCYSCKNWESTEWQKLCK